MAIEIKASSLDKNFRRTIPKPIDASSVWATYAQAAEYADNNGTDDYCPYDGQLVVTLEGYPDVSPSSQKYTEAHLWRLKYGNTTTVGGLLRQHFTLDEVKSGNDVAGTETHNIYAGTQRFGSWIELLAGMTMGFNLATGYDANGDPVVLTDDVTGQVKKLDEHGDPVTISDNDERIWLDSQGHAHMVISAIKVLGKMEVHEIDVNHIKHTGGLFVNSRANLVVSDVTEQTGGYTKLSFVQRNADGMAIYNLFEKGDLALSMTFNVVKEGVSQPTNGEVVRFYWREVDSTGIDYIILKPAGTYTGKESTDDGDYSVMSTPQVGDSVVQIGNTAKEGRQGLQCMGFSQSNGPYIAEYDGINKPSASVSFDRPLDAIVYLSPKYHKLQGDVILLKSGDQYIKLAEKLTAMANDISLKANQASLELAEKRITANANNIELNAQGIAANAQNIALKADNKWLLKMTKDSAGMYVVGEDGEAINSGRMILVANTDGSIGAVTIADNGQMEYTGDFTLKAKNIDFTAGAINMNTAKFTIGQQENVTLFESGKIKTAYIDVNSLKAKLIDAGIINAAEIVTDALTATASFDAKGATIRNLTVTGNSEFGGRLDGASGTFSGNLSAAGGTFKGSISIADGKVLIDGNEVNGVTKDGTRMHIGVNGLIAKVADELNQYLLATTNGITMQWINDGLRLSSKGLERYDGSNWVNMFSEEKARTIDGATTLDVKDGIVVCTKMESHYTVTLPPTSTELVDGKTIQIIATDTSKNHYIVVKPNSNQQITTSAAGNNENGGRKLLHANRCWVTYLGGFWHFSATGGSDA